MIQLTLTLKMTTAKVVETSVTDSNNSPIQDDLHPDDHTEPTCTNGMIPGFKPFTVIHVTIRQCKLKIRMFSKRFSLLVGPKEFIAV